MADTSTSQKLSSRVGDFVERHSDTLKTLRVPVALAGFAIGALIGARTSPNFNPPLPSAGAEIIPNVQSDKHHCKTSGD